MKEITFDIKHSFDSNLGTYLNDELYIKLMFMVKEELNQEFNIKHSFDSNLGAELNNELYIKLMFMVKEELNQEFNQLNGEIL